VPTPAIYVSTPDFVRHPRAPWFCHLRVLPSVNLHRSCPRPRSTSPLPTSCITPVPPRCVVHLFSFSVLTNRPSLPPARLPQPRRHSPRAMRPRHRSPRRTMCSPWQWPRPRSLPKSASRTREKTRSGARWRRVTSCVPWICTRSSSSRHGRLAGRRRPQIYRYGSGGTSLCSATRSSEGGRARGTPDRRGKHLPLLCPTLLPMPSAPPSSDLPQQRTPLLTMPRLASPTVKAASMSVAPFHSHARRELRRPRPSPPEPRSAPLPRPTPSAQLTPPRVIDPAPLAPHQSRQNPIAAAVNLAATSTCSKCRRRPTSSSRCDPPSLPRLL
jgi:hypothetical protein